MQNRVQCKPFGSSYSHLPLVHIQVLYKIERRIVLLLLYRTILLHFHLIAVDKIKLFCQPSKIPVLTLVFNGHGIALS